MKHILFILSVLMFNLSFGQNLKVNQAEYYFKNYRFSESTPIFKELIEKNQIKLEQNLSVYRNAYQSALKSKDVDFAISVLGKLSATNQLSFDDLFAYFQVLIYTGNYDKAFSLLERDVFLNAQNDSRKDVLLSYKENKIDVINKIQADSTKYKVQLSMINSNRGDFGLNYHPNGYYYSSAKDLASKKWSYDNSYFLNIYLFEKKTSKTKTLKFIKSKHHDAAAYYDSINKIWYYTKNFSAKKGAGLTTTGIYIYNEKTKEEQAFQYNVEGKFTGHPYLSTDGKTLWFSSDRPGTLGEADIWYCTRSDNAWSEPKNAGSIINTVAKEMFPTVHGSKLYFSSNGHVGLGGLDIYSVSIAEDGSTKNFKNIGAGLNSNSDDFYLVLDKSNKKGFFSSNRKDFIDRIYQVEIKSLDFIYKATLVADYPNDIDIKKLPIVIKDGDQVIDTLFANDNAQIEFLGLENKKYDIVIADPKIFTANDVFSTIGKTESDTTFSTINIHSKYITANTLVEDSKTHKPIPNSTVLIKDEATGETKKYISDSKGYISVELERNKKFDIEASHKGYFDNEIAVTTISTEKVLNNKIDLKLIVKGSTIEIDNVLYDFGKSTLRPESKVELDKLVDFFKGNPQMKVELSSHTDSRGGDARNMVLSQQRAQSCVDYLISKGINKTQIVAKGYGETKLINKCSNGVPCTEEEHQKNRRTEIKILSVGR